LLARLSVHRVLLIFLAIETLLKPKVHETAETEARHGAHVEVREYRAA